ncbi:type II toxin-antitoxin system ParD family antitoxin [Alcanivoracaceae bacterium MT1]
MLRNPDQNIPIIGTTDLTLCKKNTSITLGQHFDEFIAEQLKNGRYRSTSEVVRAGLRLLEESETRLTTLRKLLKEGEDSGFEDYSYDAFIRELDDAER